MCYHFPFYLVCHYQSIILRFSFPSADIPAVVHHHPLIHSFIHALVFLHQMSLPPTSQGKRRSYSGNSTNFHRIKPIFLITSYRFIYHLSNSGTLSFKTGPFLKCTVFVILEFTKINFLCYMYMGDRR